MRARFTGAIAVATALVLASSFANAQANFRDFVTFGDSLTHNDLIWLVTGVPRQVYGDDPFEALFDKGRVSGDDLSSYAIAGSQSDDVSLQIDLYELNIFFRLQDRATIIGYEIGGNDILNNQSLLQSYPPGDNASADAVIDRLLRNIRQNLTELSQNHRNAQLIIWTVPDVTVTPDNWGQLNGTQIANLRAHTERANRSIRMLDRYRNVVVLDLFPLSQIVTANPPILRGQQLDPPPDWGEFDDLFADEIHPTSVTNALVANGMILGINQKFGDDIPMYTEDELADLARIP